MITIRRTARASFAVVLLSLVMALPVRLHPDERSDIPPEKTKPSLIANNSIKPAAPPIELPQAEAKIVSQPDGGDYIASEGRNYPLRTYKTLAVNDPAANQWWTARTGLDSTWPVPVPAQKSIVAIIDTGFALSHEEFAGRWATNNGEIGAAATEANSDLNCSGQGLALNKSCNNIDDDYDGLNDNETGATSLQNPSRLNCTAQGRALDKSCNLIDDDANGYVDDNAGWDFANYDNNSQAGEITPNGEGTTHGSRVAGVLAANGNNAKGMAGVDWSAELLPLQAIDDNGYGNTLTVARAVRYATDRGADVISLSLGTDMEDAYLRNAIQYALDNGAIVVAASGNDGCDCISYPAAYPEVLAVGAESQAGGPASFSSYGAELDILAPGDGIYTASWTAANPTNAYASGVAGTSFATPYVSGLLSRARSLQPDAGWTEIIASLRSQADHSGLSVVSPVSPTLGSGYVRASSFLSRLTTPAAPAMRYYFSPFTSQHSLDTSLAHQCLDGDFPSTQMYKLAKNGQTYYTANTLKALRFPADGWTVQKLFYSCVGLKTDIPGASRVIDLNNETANAGFTKYSIAGPL